MNNTSKSNRLIQAILMNDMTSLKDTLKRASTDNLINYSHDSETPLTLACQKGNSFIINQLLSHPKIDINLPNKKKNYPIHYLAKNPNLVPILNNLIERPDIDLTVVNGSNNILHYLVANNQFDLFEKILDKKLDFAMKQNNSLFTYLFKTNNVNAVKKLYELSQKHCDIILLTSHNKLDLLEGAISEHALSCIDFLLPLKLKSYQKKNHLGIYLAVEHGNLDLIKKLVHSEIGTIQNIRVGLNKAAKGSKIYEYLEEHLNILKEKSTLEQGMKKRLQHDMKHRVDEITQKNIVVDIKKKNKI